MNKNVASQKIQLFAFDTTTGSPKTGDAANLTAYVSKDHGAVTVLGDTSAAEMDATNAKGVYVFDLTQGETNGDELTFTAKSSTANISITPRFVTTNPANFTATSIDSNGRVDVIKVAGTTQTAGDIIGDTNDIQTRLPAALVSGRIDASVGAMAANVITASALATDAVDEIVDGVWDEPLTGATHNVGSSSGKRLRQITDEVVDSGTAQAGAVTNITLAATASATNGIYDPGIVRISSGTGAGQSRLIIDYNGTTKVASIDRDWRIVPDATSVYEVVYSPNIISTNEGLAQAGAAGSITLNAQADSNDDVYVGQIVVLRTGTGQDQSRVVNAYNGTTKVATVAPNWVVNPAAGTGYVMWPIGWARVGAMEANTITAAATAADFTTEVTTGLAQEATLVTIAGYIDTEVAAIKAKTDNLPASPAAVGSAMTLTSGERTSVADALLDRDMATGTDSGGRTVRNALRFLRNLWSISGTTLTVKKEDDTTTAWTSTLTAAPGADPISGSDPA